MDVIQEYILNRVPTFFSYSALWRSYYQNHTHHGIEPYLTSLFTNISSTLGVGASSSSTVSGWRTTQLGNSYAPSNNHKTPKTTTTTTTGGTSSLTSSLQTLLVLGLTIFFAIKIASFIVRSLVAWLVALVKMVFWIVALSLVIGFWYDGGSLIPVFLAFVTGAGRAAVDGVWREVVLGAGGAGQAPRIAAAAAAAAGGR